MRGLQSDDRKKSEKQTAPEDVSSPPFPPTELCKVCSDSQKAHPHPVRWSLHDLDTHHLEVAIMVTRTTWDAVMSEGPLVPMPMKHKAGSRRQQGSVTWEDREFLLSE